MLLSHGQRISFLLLLLFLIGRACPASAIGFHSTWLYRQVGGEDINTREEFQQRYYLGVGPSLAYSPSHAISAGASVGYTRTHADQGKGMQTRDEITPAAYVSLHNDIFLAQLSGSTSGFSSDSRLEDTSRSWGATLASRWRIPYWPSVRFNHSQRIDPNEDATTDTNSVALNWNLSLAQLYYQYSNSQIKNEETKALVDTDTHFARAETSGRFWDKRLNFNFAQQFQTSTKHLTSRAQDDGSFNFPLDAQTLAAVTDQPPADLDLVDVAAESSPILGDSIIDPLERSTDSAVIVPADQYVHLGLGFESLQQIDLLTITLLPGTLTEEQVANLQWSLYVEEGNLHPWQVAVENIPGVSYDAAENRIIIPLNILASKIKVVALNQTGVELVVTELEAFSLLSEFSSSSRSTNYLTNASTRIHLTPTLTASSNLTLERYESDFGERSSESTRRSLAGRLGWQPTPAFSPSVGFSETRQDQSGALEEINRFYSLTVATIPLSTVGVTWGATRFERFSGEQKTAYGDRYSISSNARIYPHLTAALFFSYGDNYKWDEDEGTYLNETSYNTRLNIKAQLYRALAADLTTNYGKTGADDRESAESANSTFGLSYRPSDLLSLRGAYTTYFLGSMEESDRLTVGLTLGLLRTDKTRVTLIADHSQTDSKRQNNFALNGSWEISDSLALQSRANYSMGAKDNYSVQAYLTFSL